MTGRMGREGPMHVGGRMGKRVAVRKGINVAGAGGGSDVK